MGFMSQELLDYWFESHQGHKKLSKPHFLNNILLTILLSRKNANWLKNVRNDNIYKNWAHELTDDKF